MLFRLKKFFYLFIIKYHSKPKYLDEEFWNDILYSDLEEVFNV